MKTLILLLAIAAQSASASTFASLQQCLGTIGRQTEANGSNYASIRQGNEVLVVNSKGAKTISVTQGEYGKIAVFTPPEDKQVISQNFDSGSGSEWISEGYFPPGTTDRPIPKEGPAKAISVEAAATMAGPVALQAAKKRAENLERDLKRLGERVRSGNQNDDARLDSSYLKSLQSRNNQMKRNVEACEKYPNADLKEVAALEKKRLNAINEKIAALQAASENELKALADCTNRKKEDSEKGAIR